VYYGAQSGCRPCLHAVLPTHRDSGRYHRTLHGLCRTPPILISPGYAASARLGTEKCSLWPSWVPDWRNGPTHPRPEVIDPLPMVRFTGNALHDVIELEIMQSVTENEERLRVQPNDVVRMGKSLREFLCKVMILYQTLDVDRFMDIILNLHERAWPPLLGLEVYLCHYMRTLWKESTEYANELRHKRIRKIVAGFWSKPVFKEKDTFVMGGMTWLKATSSFLCV
jgi:hypothetical protein